jgi:hypothetical protein
MVVARYRGHISAVAAIRVHLFWVVDVSRCVPSCRLVATNTGMSPGSVITRCVALVSPVPCRFVAASAPVLFGLVVKPSHVVARFVGVSIIA